MSKLKTTIKISNIRSSIEKADLELLHLLKKRFSFTEKLQRLKKSLNIPITQKEREKKLLERYLQFAKRNNLPNALIKKIYSLIFAYSKKTGIIKRTIKNLNGGNSRQKRAG